MRRSLILVSLILASCAGPPKKAEPPTVNMGQSVVIDRDLLKSCEPPPKLSGVEESELIAWLKTVLVFYKECSSKNDAHVDLLKKNFPDSVKDPQK